MHGASCVFLSHAWQPLRSHLVRIASILSVRAMPKKKKTNPDWMRPTAERLDAVQQHFGASGEHLPPDAVVGMMYTAHPNEFNELASQPSLHPMSARPATADAQWCARAARMACRCTGAQTSSPLIPIQRVTLSWSQAVLSRSLVSSKLALAKFEGSCGACLFQLCACVTPHRS